jgi:hypothetical protein
MKTQFSPFPLWELVMEFLGHDTARISYYSNLKDKSCHGRKEGERKAKAGPKRPCLYERVLFLRRDGTGFAVF